MASSTTTMLDPNLCQTVPEAERLLSVSPVRISSRDMLTMGVREKITMLSNEIVTVKVSTCGVTPSPVEVGHAGESVGGDESYEQVHGAIGDSEADHGGGDGQH